MSVNNNNGVVLYCDGSASPTNPGPIGWGIHGYMYEVKDLKKPYSVDGHLITNKGYLDGPKQQKSDWLEVEPTKYIDIIGSSIEPGTNNRAEILAVLTALQELKNYVVSIIEIYTDSEYTVNATTKWIKQWIKHGWIKQDGSPVSNSDLLKELAKELEELKTKDIVFNISWVRGHNDVMGNVQADQLATIGSNRSLIGKAVVEATLSDVKGYWKADIDKHPFINFSRMYFNTLPEFNIPGLYFQSNPTKDDLIIGKRLPATGYSVIKLKDPDKIIETIKSKHCKVTNGYNVVSMIKIDRVYHTSIYPYLDQYGDCALYKDRKNFNLNSVDRKAIAVEVNPTGLSLRAIEAFNFLEETLAKYINHRHEQGELAVFTDYFDITDQFYNYETKLVKKEERIICSLKPEITTAQTEMILNITYRDHLKTLRVPIEMGLDMLPRNNLKKLEEHSPKIFLVTWQETPTVIRYATIIDSDIGVGLWSNYFSDKLFI